MQPDPEDVRHRDRLLRLAREVVDAAPPERDDATIAGAVRAVLVAHAARAIEVEAGFALDATTGVEALAFAVGPPGVDRPGGVILRLPGERPDSFEAVTGAGSAADLRRAWFRPGADTPG